MTKVLGYIVCALVVAFITYRHVCEINYRRACKRRRPFRGVRIVVMRPRSAASAEPYAPLRSTTGHQLRLVTSNSQLPIPKETAHG